MTGRAANGGVTEWDDIRNRQQPHNNLKAMGLDNLCFFYHSRQKSRRIMGVVAVILVWYEDKDGGGGAVGEMRRSVYLAKMKGHEGLKRGGF